MATSWMRWITTSLIAVLVIATAGADAEESARVRIESSYLRTVVAVASDRSPTLRRLVHGIEISNVIVYLTCEQFRSLMLRGQTSLMSANRELRYVRVQVDCMLPTTDLVEIVGHELRHVNEIAAAPAVVDARSLRILYRSIGFATCSSWRSDHFETDGALAAGARVREEFAQRSGIRTARLERPSE